MAIPETLQIIVLAIVQGIAEFLPISSSGHIVALSALFGQQHESSELNIVLHFGTLLAILVFYRQRIAALVGVDRRVVPLLVLGTLPAAAVGLWLKKNHEGLLESPLLAGWMLPVTALILVALRFIPAGDRDYVRLSWPRVLFIGVAQAVALLPGISRSGTTIVAGCLMGLKRQEAVTFSFLLAIPAISGASLLEAKKIMEQGAETPLWLLGMGALIAFAVGLVALRWLVDWVEAGKLHYFAWWLVPLGATVVIWQLWS